MNRLEKNDYEKVFLKTFIISLIFILLIVSIAPIFFYLAGEYDSIDSIVDAQLTSDEKLIYGTAIHNDTKEYKWALYNRLEPKIVALGSSRVMQFRSHMFSEVFVNLGGVMGSVTAANKIIPMLQELRPDIVILGIDPWWFNSSFHSDKKIPNKTNLVIDDRTPSSEDIWYFFSWLVSGKLDFDNVFSVMLEPSADFGLLGREKEGYWRDGSRYTVETFKGKRKIPDVNFKDTYDRIEKGNRRFQYANKSSDVHVNRFVSFVNEMSSMGIKVVMFYPPFASSVIQKMNDHGEHYGYISDLKRKLINHGLDVFDFTDPIVLDSNDCEFKDGFHGGEITYMRILHSIALQDPELTRYIDLKTIADLMVRYRGRSFVPDKTIYDGPESDFLALGCEK